MTAAANNNLQELRRDPIIGRWIIVNFAKEKGPADFKVSNEKKKSRICPFCYGNEDKTPPEIYALRPANSRPNTSGWSLRVVPNKFPALRVEGELARQGIGIYDLMNGIGAHEVIIETPEHEEDMADYSLDEIENIIRTYQGRTSDLKKDIRFKYIIIFKNHGLAAGASLEHSHSQLIALPVVPKRVKEYLSGAEAYYAYKERCVYCDIINEETRMQERLVTEDERFVVFCPYASCQPFETWIMPKRHTANFQNISPDEISALAAVLKDTLLRMKKVLGDPPFNFIINTAPLDEEHGERPDYHWHFEIVPKLVKTAGFESGTGFYINPTPPEKAASWLRGDKTRKNNKHAQGGS